MMLALAMQPKEVLEAGSKATDTLTQTVLGSLVVIFIITTGVALWLAWKAKNGELATVTKMLEAKADERVAANDLSLEQTKAYKELAEVVDSNSATLTEISRQLKDAVEDGDGETARAVEELGRRLGKRVDALANAAPGVDLPKYFAGRE